MPALGAASQPRVFDIRAFGARVDGRTVYDATTTASGTTVGSATVGFSPADVGRKVVVAGAGSGGTELVATIGAVALDGLSATVSPAASVTTTGASMTVATNDTQAVRDALVAALAAGGGQVYHPGGICLLTDAPQTGTVSGGITYNYAGVLLIPARARTEGQAVILFRGPVPPPRFWYGKYTAEKIQPEASSSAIFQFVNTSGSGIDVIPNATGDALGLFYSSWQVLSQNINWRFPNNPQGNGVNLHHACDASLVDSTVGVFATISEIKNPTGSGVGLKLPNDNDNGLSECRGVNIYGWPTSITHSEHTLLDNVYITYTQTAIEPTNDQHLSQYNKLYVAGYGRVLKVNSTLNIRAVLSLEATQQPGGPGVVADIDDPASRLRGHIEYIRFSPTDTPLMVLGGGRCDFRRLGDGSAKPSSLRPTSPSVDFAGSGAATGALPQCDSGQTWTTFGGTWSVASGKAGGAGYARVLGLNGTNPTVSATFTTGPTTSSVGVSLLGSYNPTVDVPGEFTATISGLNTVTITKVTGNVSTVAATGAFVYAANTLYTMDVDYGVTTAGTITVKVGGTPILTYALTSPEQAAFAGMKYVGMRIISGSDSGSKFSSFSSF
jgi:hypothetical protein